VIYSPVTSETWLKLEPTPSFTGTPQMPDERAPEIQPKARARTRSRRLLVCALLFLLASGVRFLHLQDNRPAIPFYGMTGEYKAHALTLVAGDFDTFLRGTDPPSDANVVKHPPGYPLLMAAVYELFGEADEPLQLVHIALDSAAVVLVFLIASELFPFAAARIAGLLVALSPQLAYHAIALLPDPLAAPPLLLAFYFLIRALKRPRVASFVAAGALVGLSCLLRSNALLLAPMLAVLSVVLFGRRRGWRYAGALLVAAIVVMLPVTVRNYLAFKSFIPLSLSAGITMVEGIGVYDKEGRFGLPSSDYAVTKWEAEKYNRPDYLGTRFSPDGVLRERRRVAAGLNVVRAHPFWFLGVMAQRAAFMLRLARVELIAAEPAVTRPLAVPDNAPPERVVMPTQLRAGDATTTDAPRAGDQSAARFTSAGTTVVATSEPFALRRDTDYLLRLPIKIEEGSVVVAVVRERDGAEIASTPILHPINYLDLTPETQPAVSTEKPFVSGDADAARVVIRNGERKLTPATTEIGRVDLFALGSSSNTWTRLPRIIVRASQKIFLTAVMLPFTILGAALMLRAGRWRALALLVAVPAYYMCVQSALWTEFRYVLAMHYFLPILTAFGIYSLAAWLWQSARSKLVPPRVHRVETL
jgi:hypothetical protein